MESIRKFILGPTQQEQVRTWQQSLRRESRQLDRQVTSIVSAEAKTKSQIKAMAKQGNKVNCRLLARELVRSQKLRARLEGSKASLNSLGMQLNEQLATIKITGTLQKSTQMMHEVNSLIKLPELTTTMAKLQSEMMKAGILDEMISDTLALDADADIEDDAEEEVDKVLNDILGSKLSEVQKVPEGLRMDAVKDAESMDAQSDDEAALNEMRSRLAALKE